MYPSAEITAPLTRTTPATVKTDTSSPVVATGVEPCELWEEDSVGSVGSVAVVGSVDSVGSEDSVGSVGSEGSGVFSLVLAI
jgi:hypothetical protein